MSSSSPRLYHNSIKTTAGYTLVYDPSDCPLSAGLLISREEHFWMMAYRSYTPGTILRRHGQLYEIIFYTWRCPVTKENEYDWAFDGGDSAILCPDADHCFGCPIYASL